MSYWLIDIESFIVVYSNNKPTKEEAKNYIKEYIEQFIANASVKIPRSEKSGLSKERKY